MVKPNKKGPATTDFVISANSAHGYYTKWKTQMRWYAYDRAENVLILGLSEYPQAAELHNAMGRTQRLKKTEAGDSSALKHFFTAHELEPTNVGFLVDYANFLSKKGKHDKAELLLFHGYNSFKGTEKQIFILGALGMLYATSNPSWAIACYDQCLAIDENNDFARRKKDEVIQAGRKSLPGSWQELLSLIEHTLKREGPQISVPVIKRAEEKGLDLE